MAHFVGLIIPETESAAVRPTSAFAVQHRPFHDVGGKHAGGDLLACWRPDRLGRIAGLRRPQSHALVQADTPSRMAGAY